MFQWPIKVLLDCHRTFALLLFRRVASTMPVSLVFVLLFAVTHLAVGAPPPSEEEILQWIMEAGPNTQPRDDFPEIRELLRNGSNVDAESAATAAIQRSDPSGNPQGAAWLRAEAFRLRAIARQAMYPRNAAPMLKDLAESAKLGNLPAIKSLVSILIPPLEEAGGFDDVGLLVSQVATDINIGDIISIGVDLGESSAIQTVIKNRKFSRYSAQQRLFLKLLSSVDSKDPLALEEIIAASPNVDVDKLIDENAFVGGPIAKGGNGVAGRDRLATLLAETSFRWKLRREFAIKMQTTAIKRDLSVRESFAILSYGRDQSGLASVYFLSPTDLGMGRRSIQMSNDKIADAVRPGDTVFVRCGPLAHQAAVFSIDVRRNEVLLVDGLSEFWRPDSNPCISEFAQIHWKYGYYHTKLRLSELLDMLIGVVSVRSYELPAQVYQIDASAADSDGIMRELEQVERACATTPERDAGRLVGSRLESFRDRELYKLSGVEEFASIQQVGVLTTTYIPKKLTARGAVALALRSNTDGCIVSASAFIRRSKLSMLDQSNEYATAVLSIFGAEEFGGDGLNSVVRDMERNSGDKERALSREVWEVLNGLRDFVHLKNGNRSVYLGNFVSDTGVRWIRADVW